ncbi:cbb3-type cytochrome c oxidase subunit I [Bradyrhizobium betae]
MLQKRRVHQHLYVSVWYIGAALFWFPVLYVVAKILGVHFGVEQATMNWWFGHNVLGLFYTPLSLAAVYYFLPKVIGRPVRSYSLSLLGFWTLAFFYGQGRRAPPDRRADSAVADHALVDRAERDDDHPGDRILGEPAPDAQGAFPVRLRHSATLRFIVFGAIMYTLASVQGSFEALRSLNAVTHTSRTSPWPTRTLACTALLSMVIFFGGIHGPAAHGRCAVAPARADLAASLAGGGRAS